MSFADVMDPGAAPALLSTPPRDAKRQPQAGSCQGSPYAVPPHHQAYRVQAPSVVSSPRIEAPDVPGLLAGESASTDSTTKGHSAANTAHSKRKWSERDHFPGRLRLTERICIHTQPSRQSGHLMPVLKSTAGASIMQATFSASCDSRRLMFLGGDPSVMNEGLTS